MKDLKAKIKSAVGEKDKYWLDDILIALRKTQGKKGSDDWFASKRIQESLAIDEDKWILGKDLDNQPIETIKWLDEIL